MVRLYRLVLDERQHAVAAAKAEEAYLKECDEELEVKHVQFIVQSSQFTVLYSSEFRVHSPLQFKVHNS